MKQKLRRISCPPPTEYIDASERTIHDREGILLQKIKDLEHENADLRSSLVNEKSKYEMLEKTYDEAHNLCCNYYRVLEYICDKITTWHVSMAFDDLKFDGDNYLDVPDEQDEYTEFCRRRNIYKQAKYTSLFDALLETIDQEPLDLHQVSGALSISKIDRLLLVYQKRNENVYREIAQELNALFLRHSNAGHELLRATEKYIVNGKVVNCGDIIDYVRKSLYSIQVIRRIINSNGQAISKTKLERYLSDMDAYLCLILDTIAKRDYALSNDGLKDKVDLLIHAGEAFKIRVAEKKNNIYQVIYDLIGEGKTDKKIGKVTALAIEEVKSDKNVFDGRGGASPPHSHL